MFRVLSRQAVKVIPRPFRLSTGTSRRIHSVQLPYTGPPSYETITRRFSSQPDPLVYFSEKRQQEALQRGEFTDIHDITPEDGFYPDQYDVLLTDITHETLEHRISDELGIVYLSKANDDLNKPIQACDGYTYGPNRRTVMPLVVSYEQQSRWVFFIVDSGSPYTYISRIASKKFGLDEEDADAAAIAQIGGYPSPVRISPPKSHFQDVNVLGTDFCHFHRVRVWQDYVKRRAKLYMGEAWKVVTDESKL